MSDSSGDLTLNAAMLRRSGVELRVFIEALADRLERALPDRIQVERKRDGLFSKTLKVTRLSIQGENAVYDLVLDRGVATGLKIKVVREVRISSTPLDMPQWLAEVRDELQALAEAQGIAGESLLSFL
ncbi:hypothetical protein BH11PSE2_BH11PSE2_01130 [soil metagenome]